MLAYSSWKKLFTKKHLSEVFYKKIWHRNYVGLDKITSMKFEENLEENIDIILKKLSNKSYRFTRYKQLLFLKGPGKPPRSVSVPTVRDRLVLSVLNELIDNVFGRSCTTPMPHSIINNIILELNNYSNFIKLDISSFYASINQEKLLKQIGYKIRKDEIFTLIKKAIQTPSIPFPCINKCRYVEVKQGVPEGLAISNALANIYLMELDKKYSNIKGIKYWRYVDDILIFANNDMFETIKKDIVKDLSNLDLETNKEKIDEGEMTKGFTYLGYLIKPNIVSVRQNSILKLEQSLEELFKKVSKSTNKEYMQWKINLRITGFVIDGQKYGWIFFFSQINDMGLLFHLDNLVEKFKKRFNVNELRFKRFVRTFFDITKSLYDLKYTPNFDNYTMAEKKKILADIYKINLTGFLDEDVNVLFSKNISNEIRDIEKDIQSIS